MCVGEDQPGLTHLRDLILVDLADQLRTQPLDTEETACLRLPDHLLHYTLRICIRESCVLLRQCQTTDRTAFEQLLASVPVSY